MLITLVRHGESEANIAGRINDDPNRPVDLTPLGRAQAAAAGERLRDLPFSHAYASGFPRARQTAAHILAGRNLPVRIDARLNERRSGLDGQPVEAFNGLVRPDPVHIKPPLGESFLEQMGRVRDFLDDIASRHPDAHVLAVSHENPILAATALSGRPVEDAARGQVDNAAGITLRWPIMAADTTTETTMSNAQPGILAPVPRLARHLFFNLAPGFAASDVQACLTTLAAQVDGLSAVAGLGQSLIAAAGGHIDGLHAFPSYETAGLTIPATPAALWCWLRGDDHGALLHRSRALEHALAPTLSLTQVVDAFQYEDSRDLTGYEDGTENPQGEAALAAALVAGQGAGRDGGSFVAVQQWVHDLDRFAAMSPELQDHSIGRRRSDNEEIDGAPESAHVKRTAQESFAPEAFVLRRSMPWADAREAGLVFVAFGHSLAAFEAQLQRMAGAEDGIRDALFGFTRPVSGAYFWCPPMRGETLDLSAL
jgi:putative iron-dependent peroxidase